MRERRCRESDCVKPHEAKGLCHTHYERERSLGTCRDCGAETTAERCRSCAQRHRFGVPTAASPIRYVECPQCGHLRAERKTRRMSDWVHQRCDACANTECECAQPNGCQHSGRWWKFLVSGPCSWCAVTFTGLVASWKTRPLYCSDTCAKKAQRAARGRFLIPDHERLAICERDNWTCQLCNEPVDRELPPSHRWAPTLDHVVPQSHQLFPDHTAANLQLAHRMCNSLKGDRTA